MEYNFFAVLCCVYIYNLELTHSFSCMLGDILQEFSVLS